MLYRSKLKKYHTPYYDADVNENKGSMQNSLGVTPLHQLESNKFTSEFISTPLMSTPNITQSESEKISKQVITVETPAGDVMHVEENPIITKLQESLDFLVTQAEQLYYNCDYQKCTLLTESILKEDPYHNGCLPIHISCQVELKQSNSKYKANIY